MSVPRQANQRQFYRAGDTTTAVELREAAPHDLSFRNKNEQIMLCLCGRPDRLKKEMVLTGPKSAILHEAEFPKISRAGGATTSQIVTPDCGAAAFLSGFTDIPPGAGIPLHYHNCEEAVLVVSGIATVEVDGEQFGASEGDVVWQAANVPHRFINPSDSDTLRIYWTYASSDATRTLVETGETGPVLAEQR